MKFRFLYFLASVLLSMGIFVWDYTYTEAIQLNADVKEISVVVDENFPPYVFKDEQGNLNGILVDEWKLWSIKTGIRVKLDAMNWDKAQALMKEGKYNVIGTIFKNEERENMYLFSKPYADIEVLAFFNKNISGIKDVKSLNGFKVGIKKGDSNIQILKQNEIKEYMEFNSYEDIVKAAKDNKINAFIMGKPSGLYYLYKYKIQDDFRHTKSQYTGQFHRAVKKEDHELLKVIDYGFSRITKSEHKEIYNKWFGFEYMGPNLLFYIKIFITVALILSIILILWSITLKRSVHQKTLQLTNTIEKLKKSENRISAIFKSMPDLFFIITKDGIFTDYETKDTTKLLYPPELFLNKSISEIFEVDLSEKFMHALQACITLNETKMVEYSIIELEKTKYFEVRIIKYDKDLALAIVRDITERKLSDMKIYDMSIKDEVTGLYNRNYFENKIEIRNKQKLLNCAMIVCDLDGLKIINDTLGHTVGDEYLKIAANILKKCFEKGEAVIARIGGDEFGILLNDISETEVVHIKSTLEAMIEEINEDKVIPVSISIGYSVSVDTVRDLREMFKEADNFMYKEKLHHKQSSKSDLVNILTKMLETRDFVTEGHCDRLQVLSVKLAKVVGMNDGQIQDIALFSKFHDIGKIGVSDKVLFKSGRLTEEEFEEMKRHTEIGYRIAQSSPDITHIADWILKHHEWWNGNGYPFGLKENKIPIQCRILSIVDAYDAMISDRPYRKARSKEDAINELKGCRGVQFDPYLLDEFLKIIER